MDRGINSITINNLIKINEMQAKTQGVDAAARRVAGGKDNEALKNACMDFEKIFLSEMFKCMKNTVPKSSLVSRGFASDIFESMLDDELMQRASRTGTFGLADILYRQLCKQVVNVDNDKGELVR